MLLTCHPTLPQDSPLQKCKATLLPSVSSQPRLMAPSQLLTFTNQPRTPHSPTPGLCLQLTYLSPNSTVALYLPNPTQGVHNPSHSDNLLLLCLSSLPSIPPQAVMMYLSVGLPTILVFGSSGSFTSTSMPYFFPMHLMISIFPSPQLPPWCHSGSCSALDLLVTELKVDTFPIASTHLPPSSLSKPLNLEAA